MRPHNGRELGHEKLCAFELLRHRPAQSLGFVGHVSVEHGDVRVALADMIGHPRQDTAQGPGFGARPGQHLHTPLGHVEHRFDLQHGA